MLSPDVFPGLPRVQYWEPLMGTRGWQFPPQRLRHCGGQWEPWIRRRVELARYR